MMTVVAADDGVRAQQPLGRAAVATDDRVAADDRRPSPPMITSLERRRPAS